MLNGLKTTAEDIRDSWTKIASMDAARHLNSIDGTFYTRKSSGTQSNLQFSEASGEVLSAVEEAKSKMSAMGQGGVSKDHKSGMNPALARASKIPADFFEYNSRDAIIYALGSE